MALTYESFMILDDGVVNYHLITFVFTSTVFIYIMHRLHGLRTLKGSIEIKRISWVQKNKKPLLILAIISGLISLGCSFFMSLPMILLLIPLGLISVFYTVPFIKIGGLKISLRKIPFIKIGLIAFVWSGICVLLPALEIYGTFSQINMGVMLLMFERFLFVFAITIPFDVRDISLDKANNVITIPKLIGFKKSLKLAGLLLFVTAILSILNYFLFNYYSVYHVITLCLVYFIAIILVNKTTEKSEDQFYLGWIDGTMILHGTVISIVTVLVKNFG